jgi:hypothetical protein
MKVPDNIVAIWGVPRSGTTWLGQILNSSPNTLFRYQPLFSHRFKDSLSNVSSGQDISSFLYRIVKTKDEFVLNGLANEEEKKRLQFYKNSNPSHLVMKHVRYHHIIENILNQTNIKIIGIVRNPCAVINSWIKAPREFDNTWDPIKEWQIAKKKNMNRVEEYYGFEKWKEAINNFIKFEEKFPDTFRIIRYEELINAPIGKTKELFSFINLGFAKQTEMFLNECNSRHEENEYTVFRDKSVKDKWKTQLNSNIRDHIYNDLKDTDFEMYLND